ncbi:MAG: DUF1902 domain-containing protein [Gammaproteobacteria bacterium]|nr:DUF1902 domain-containing protein [Gammaproteobacteria bacterium]
MVRSITIHVAFDADARVRRGRVQRPARPECSRADTLEDMQAALPGAVLDLLDADTSANGGPRDVPIELIAHTQTQVRIGA